MPRALSFPASTSFSPRHRRRLRVGLATIGKFVFSHEAALQEKRRLEAMPLPAETEWVGIDAVVPEGILRDITQVDAVADHFQREGIDALFIPHGNFGTEGAAAMLARACNRPTLLWGPRDSAPLPDGSRAQDTLCGLLASSRVLHLLGVPFSYIENSTSESETFRTGFDRFCRAARVVRTLRTARIGMIGQRIDFFWSTIVSEADLLQRFGVQVLPIDLPAVLTSTRQRAKADAKHYAAELAELRSWIDLSIHDAGTPYAPGAAGDPTLHLAFRDELLSLAREKELDALCLQTFPTLADALGLTPALGVSLANDAGLPVSPESDLHGAVSSLLLEAASSSDLPSFLPDITIRHPQRDDAVLLWHFEAPLRLRDPKSPVSLGQPWILKGLPAGLVHFKLMDGPLTIARFDGDPQAGYRLGFGEGTTCDGPPTQEYYAWMAVDHWPRWERQLIEGPYIHHCSCVFDSCAQVLGEAVRFIPGLEAERFGGASQTPG